MDSKVGNDRKEVFALDTLLESFLERLGMDRRRIFKAIILSWIVCIIFLFFFFLFSFSSLISSLSSKNLYNLPKIFSSTLKHLSGVNVKAEIK